ncbi:MAG: transporter substrate-binding protein [Marmoricola sp.]|nr:transporter substrate-binding protein [Marmoricola sp.]
MRTRFTGIVAVLLGSIVVLAGCGSSASSTAGSKTIVIATHDSWAMSKSVMAAFTKQTGITVKIEQHGDAGELTNKLVLTKGNPIADGVFGIDNTFATRAVDAGILADYTPWSEPASVSRFNLAQGSSQLTPIDYGDVCVNVDNTWFAKKKLSPPKTFEDLTAPAYKGLTVTPAATTSSTGLAFLAGTIGRFGNGWKAYWTKLTANGLKIDPGWTEAYEGDFTAGGGQGTYPIVVSYSSSPPYTVPKAGGAPTTSALLDTCFRQVEYAGVLKGASNPGGVEKFIDFMQGRQFQAALPENMYVYPVDTTVALPPDWARWAPVSPHPYAVSAADITANRNAWLRDWRDLTSR